MRECLLEVDDLSCPNVFFALFLILPISLFRQDKGGEWCGSFTSGYRTEPNTVLHRDSCHGVLRDWRTMVLGVE